MKTWLITGANRGLGVEMSKAVLANGDRVIATGRDASQVSAALGKEFDRLQILRLDVTDNTSISMAVEAAVARFGQIDVLVNNAGYGHLGFFEETTDADARAQFESNVFGLMNVTRAIIARDAGKAQRSHLQPFIPGRNAGLGVQLPVLR